MALLGDTQLARLYSISVPETFLLYFENWHSVGPTKLDIILENKIQLTSKFAKDVISKSCSTN